MNNTIQESLILILIHKSSHNSAAGMDLWGAHHRLLFIGRHEEDGTPDTSMGEESNDEEEKIIKTEPVFVPEIKKRKRLSLSQLKEVKEESHGKKRRCMRPHLRPNFDLDFTKLSLVKAELGLKSLNSVSDLV